MRNDKDNLADHQMRVDAERTLGQIFELLGQVNILHDAVQSIDLRQAQVMAALGTNIRQRHRIVAPLISNDFDQLQPMLDELSTTLKEIDDQIPSDFAADIPSDFTIGDSEVFCFGTVHKLLEQKPILRGFAEAVKSEPVGSTQSRKLAFCLISIPGLKEKLCRENHGHFGYHYHYLDKDERRSDTVLTFGNPQAGTKGVTLFFEKHAIKKAGFVAKMNLWGNKKRISTYATCAPDLKKWPLSEFKRPSIDASPLWSNRSAP
ncbi:hypothetical protein [Roseovarius sp. M141]|uniref:hypothetical protein n=1 Tax=Roseovarius sp. M141 TaxID=2583806 RepID=UPI0020CC6968|nr:hypothetical protein [Roseovarius sp. M141]MCQ0093403.1 hypothetical protein [Roseovarius sp. M141]